MNETALCQRTDIRNSNVANSRSNLKEIEELLSKYQVSICPSIFHSVDLQSNLNLAAQPGLDRVDGGVFLKMCNKFLKKMNKN